MPLFFSRLSYSLGNEDWETEHRALNLKPEDRVLCITGSGDRPLHLLLRKCKEVVTIDANPIQNHLLRLKMAALHQLDYENYASFLGLFPNKSRVNLLRQLSAHLDKDSAKYWNQNHKMISKGILYQGAMEKYALMMPVVAKCIQGKSVKKLFSFNHLDEQASFVADNWDNMMWRKCFEIILSPKISKWFLRDPGLYADVDDTIKPGAYLYKKMNECLKRHVAKDNFFISLCLQGTVDPSASPAYLMEDGSKIIKSGLDAIKIETGDLIHYLETAPPNSFDAFSLSDVASYISEDTFKRLLKAVKRTARPGARFCIREFLSKRQIPSDLKQYFHRNYDLEDELEQDDRCFVYRFMTGHVK